MKEIDVNLLLPPLHLTGRVADHHPKEALGLSYLAAVLRKEGFNVEILDADFSGLTVKQTVNILKERPSKILGISTLQRALPSTVQIIDTLKEVGINSHVCIGGFSATLSANKLLERVDRIDSIVIGEGEITFLELVKKLCGSEFWKDTKGLAFKDGKEVIRTEPRPKINDLDKLPFPARDMLPSMYQKAGYAAVLSSRGCCHAKCSFCSNAPYERANPGPRWRGRKAENIVDEMENLIHQFGVSVFKFDDPEMFGPGETGKNHVRRLCEEIINRNLRVHLMGFCRINDVNYEMASLMKEAGFERLLIGIESTDKYTLQQFKKGITIDQIENALQILKSTGISLVPGFMPFNPYTTLETLKSDIEFAQEKGFNILWSKALRIFDGTPIQTQISKEGRLVERHPIDGYHDYIMDEKIARIYQVMKVLFAGIIDPLKKENHSVMWGVKKTPRFDSRPSYDQITRKIWELEIKTLKLLIRWAEGENIPNEKWESHFKEQTSEFQKLRERLLSGDLHEDAVEKETPQLNYRVFQFRVAAKTIALDLRSNIMFEVDKIMAEALSAIDSMSKDKIIERLSLKYPRTEVMEVLNRIEELEAKGVITNREAGSRSIKYASSASLARKAWKILNEKIDPTLPEKYRWLND